MALAGKQLDDRYRLEALIGSGGMGEVYRAFDVTRQTSVAVKVLPSGAISEESLARFQREAELAARVDRHGGLVRIHAFGAARGLHYLVMELVDGHELAHEFEAGPMEPQRLARILEAVARTLAACHVEGVIHRDIKPSNLLIRASDDAPRIMDFGLARHASSDALTQTGQLLGTPAYMPPEMARDSSRATGPTVDVYSLGATLYHGLTGRPPFVGGTPINVLAQLATERPKAPSSLIPTVDRHLEAICLRAMDREPERRYASATEFADALQGYLQGDPSLEPTRSPWVALGVGVGVLFALGIGLGLYAADVLGPASPASGSASDPKLAVGLPAPVRDLSRSGRAVDALVALAETPGAGATGAARSLLLSAHAEAVGQLLEADGAERLEAVVASAQALDLSLDPARAPKRTALGAQAQEWASRLERAIAKQDEARVLSVLKRVTQLEPRVALPEALLTGLRKGAETIVDQVPISVSGFDTARAERLAAFEGLRATLDPEWRSPQGYRAALTEGWVQSLSADVAGPEWTAIVVSQDLPIGEGLYVDDVSSLLKLDPRRSEAWIASEPPTRAKRYGALAWRFRQQQPNLLGGLRPDPEVMALCEAILADGLPGHLGRRYRAEVLAIWARYAAVDLRQAGSARGPDWDRRWALASARCREVYPVDMPEAALVARLAQSALDSLVGRVHERVTVWDEAVKAMRLKNAKRGSRRDRRRFSRALFEHALALEFAGRGIAAAKARRRAESACRPADVLLNYREIGRPLGGERYLRHLPPETYNDEEFVEQYVYLAIDRGEFRIARRRLEEIARDWPEVDLRQLQVDIDNQERAAADEGALPNASPAGGW